METIISGITLGQLAAWVIAIAAAITGIGKAIDYIASKRKKYPCQERLEMLANDKKRLERLEEFQENQLEANAILMRSIYALINHEITGNSIDKLKSTQDEINNFLIKR